MFLFLYLYYNCDTADFIMTMLNKHILNSHIKTLFIENIHCTYVYVYIYIYTHYDQHVSCDQYFIQILIGFGFDDI